MDCILCQPVISVALKDEQDERSFREAITLKHGKDTIWNGLCVCECDTYTKAG